MIRTVDWRTDVALEKGRHDRSSSFVGYLALPILGGCGGSLLAPDFVG